MSRESKLFAHKTPDGFRHIGPNELYVELHGGKWPIVPIVVKEDPDGTYWAWWDNEHEDFRMIYNAKVLCEICFPYGYEVAEKTGRGKLMKVSVYENPELIK